jgi:serine/threonine protein kinase
MEQKKAGPFGIVNFYQTRPFDKDFDLQKKIIARGDYSEIR